MSEKPKEQWGTADLYERYVGRWSRLVAREFLAWLSVSEGKRWADVGCGTGGIVEGILTDYAPRAVIGIDRAEGFLAEARRRITDPRVHFKLGDMVYPAKEHGQTPRSVGTFQSPATAAGATAGCACRP